MKKTFVICVMACITLMIAMVVQADDSSAKGEPWFDLENCSMCKHLNAESGLLDNIKWEHHLISTGMLTVTQVPEDYKEKYESASKHMQETSQQLMQGKQLPMCGMCQSMGTLFQSGKVSWESFETGVGMVSVMTSTDPDIIKKIRAHAQRTIDEYKTWAAERSK